MLSQTKIIPIPDIGIDAMIEYNIIGNPGAKYKIFIFHEMGVTYTRWKTALPNLVRNMKEYLFIIPNRPGYGNSKGFFTRDGKILSQTQIGKLTDIVHSSTQSKLDTERYIGFSYYLFSHIIDHISHAEGWNKFYVAGYSSGGPCALACAAHLGPKRVLGTLVVSGDTDYRRIKIEDNYDAAKIRCICE